MRGFHASCSRDPPIFLEKRRWHPPCALTPANADRLMNLVRLKVLTTFVCGLLFPFASCLGQNWTAQAVPWNYWQWVVSSVDGSTMFVVASNGPIYKSIN